MLMRRRMPSGSVGARVRPAVPGRQRRHTRAMRALASPCAHRSSHGSHPITTLRAHRTPLTLLLRAARGLAWWRRRYRMQAAGVPPNEWCYGAAISACEAAGEWVKAVRLLQRRSLIN